MNFQAAKLILKFLGLVARGRLHIAEKRLELVSVGGALIERLDYGNCWVELGGGLDQPVNVRVKLLVVAIRGVTRLLLCPLEVARFVQVLALQAIFLLLLLFQLANRLLRYF